jgi:hypothetical protein
VSDIKGRGAKVRVGFVLDMKSHHWVIRAQCFKQHSTIHKGQNVREDEDTTLPQNVGIQLPSDAVSYLEQNLQLQNCENLNIQIKNDDV